MLKLWKNCDVYAPAHLGRRDILMEGGVIAAVEPDLSRWESAPEIESRDLAGAVVCPGLIDLHVHVTGGGGEQGPASRTPELQLTDFTRNGVTSVLFAKSLFISRIFNHFQCLLVLGVYAF